MTMRICSVIKGVGHYVPEKIYTNHDLSQMMDTSDSWIQERTGIKERHIASLSEGTSDLGVKAAKAALDHARVSVSDIDLILAATLSPDHFFPGIGVMIQDKLGAPNVGALDIRGQCSGFSWCLATGDAYIRSGLYRNVLIVGAEIHSRIIEFSNRGRNVSVLFGDGAGAVILSRHSDQSQEKLAKSSDTRGLIDHELGSDGSGAKLLAVDRPGCQAGHASFISGSEAADKAYLPVMDGRQVFKNAVARMTQVIDVLLSRNGLKPENIDLLIPHQANIRINDMVRQKTGIPESKVFNNIHKYGNTTSATLPLCMYEAEKAGKLRRGDLVVTVAFGSGFTWGANLLRW